MPSVALQADIVSFNAMISAGQKIFWWVKNRVIPIKQHFFYVDVGYMPVIPIFNSHFWWHVDAEIPVLGVSLQPCGCQQEEPPKKGMAAMARKSTRISQMVRCGSSYKQLYIYICI